MTHACQDPRDVPPPIEVKYANYLKVGHNAVEFVWEFGQIFTIVEDERCSARIVTSPFYAKCFLATLRDSIDQYEQTFGVIQT